MYSGLFVFIFQVRVHRIMDNADIFEVILQGPMLCTYYKEVELNNCRVIKWQQQKKKWQIIPFIFPLNDFACALYSHKYTGQW